MERNPCFIFLKCFMFFIILKAKDTNKLLLVRNTLSYIRNLTKQILAIFIYFIHFICIATNSQHISS